MHRLSLRAARLSHAQLRIRQQPPATSHTLSLIKAFTTSSLKREESSNGSPPKVRWYQQLFAGAPIKPIDPENEDEDADDDTGEARQLREQINRLEEELKELRGEGTSASPIEPLLKQLSEEDRAKVEAALKQADLEDPDHSETRAKAIEALDAFHDDAAAQSMPYQSDLNVPLDLSPNQNKFLERLNKALFYAARDTSDPSLRKILWQAYQRCKLQNLPFIDLVPKKAWDVLWATQLAVSPNAQHRAEHLRILAADMQKSGNELNLDQRIIYMKSLSDEGRGNEAIEQWYNQQRLLSQDERNSLTFQALGVHLNISLGNPFNAEQIAMRTIARSDAEHAKEHSRILIPVIEAWARVDGDVGIKKAWAIYLRLRMILDSEMNLHDYDEITTGFLNAGRTDVALAVFKDLMLTGEESMYRSDELYRKSLGIIGQLLWDSVDISELTKVSLTALTVLPKHFQNKFFFASWLKKLIGMGKTDAAAMVVELMYERNTKPDAKHLNGIIGAWLRSGHTADREKAEQMGWAMVHERLDFVARRRGTIPPKDPSARRLPERLDRTVPPATIETFSILLQHYERRGAQERVQLLRDQLPLAEIHPNAYFMNHLLYAELRRGEHRAAWRLYQQMSRKVTPDLETFACLWDCEKSHLDRFTMYNADAFPGPRRIMCDMISWYSKSDKGARTNAQHDFSKDLYDQIIRCFCLAKDVEGTIVGLYALRESFQSYPDSETSRMTTLQAASMGVGERKKSRRSRLSGNVQSKANISKMMQVLGLIAQQRAAYLEQKGIQIGADDEIRQKEEHLYILAQFLRAILQRQGNDELAVGKKIDEAAWEMGVSGMRMVDPLITLWKEDERIA